MLWLQPTEMHKNSSIHFAYRFPWAKGFSSSKARLRHFGLWPYCMPEYLSPSSTPANIFPPKETPLLWNTSHSLCLTPQIYLGEGLVEQYAPASTLLNPDTELRRAETSFPTLFWRRGRGWGNLLFQCLGITVHGGHPNSPIRSRTPLNHNKVIMLGSL